MEDWQRQEQGGTNLVSVLVFPLRNQNACLAESLNWLRAPKSAREWMRQRPIVYCVRSLPDQEILYIGESSSMWRRLYDYRGYHQALAYFQAHGFHYEVLYDQDLLPEQQRLTREIELTAELKPWWNYRCDLKQRQAWVKAFKATKEKSFFPLHKLPERQLALL